MASATDVPCKAQAEALLAQVSSESGKDVPIDTRVGQASQKVARFKKEYAQAIDARYSAERLYRDTKEKAIRVADMKWNKQRKSCAKCVR